MGYLPPTQIMGYSTIRTKRFMYTERGGDMSIFEPESKILTN